MKNGKDEYCRVLSGGRERDPGNAFEQARKSLHTITVILKIEKLPSWYGGCFGYAVCFPDQTNRSAIPNDGDTSMVFLAEHLDDMGRAVRGAFKRWNRRENPSIRADAMRLCCERLRPVFGLFPARWRELEYDEEQLVTLTAQQQQVLEGLSDNDRLAVRGGAGTGKTMLALWRAVEYARNGIDTLFLCFNRQLSIWLNERIEEEVDEATRRRLRICTFHSLCSEFYRKGRVAFSPPADPIDAATFWTEVVPNKMFDLLLDEVPELRFDAIVVDEAQDFRTDWWMVIEALNCQANGRLTIFHDPNQNIFNDENAVPHTEAVFNLKINCRNTREIHSYSAKRVNADVQPSPRVPAGVPPIEKEAADAREQRELCESIIKTWKSDYRIEPSRLAILSHRVLSPSCLNGVQKIAGFAITSNFSEWKHGNGVIFATFAAFKGLEADAVVLLTSRTSAPSPSDLYVASSRAKHLLAIVETLSEP